jgi:hypothetical protein
MQSWLASRNAELLSAWMARVEQAEPGEPIRVTIGTFRCDEDVIFEALGYAAERGVEVLFLGQYWETADN